jgi:membrane associated rhomboid family serine protease
LTPGDDFVRRPPPPQDWLKYPVTSGVATLAIFVSVARFAGKDVSFLYMYSDTWHVQPWGLLTAIFPHVHPIHLIFNLYWLWVFGTLVEAVYGPARTVAIMFLFAVGSSAAEFAIFEQGIGLSGVGYGLFALLWILSRKDDRFRGAVDSQTINLFVFWFFLCIYLTYTGTWRVGNVAHGMGALLGALLGFCIMTQDSNRKLAESVLGLVIAADILLACFARDYVKTMPLRWEEFAFLGYMNLVDQNYKQAVGNLEQALKLNSQDASTWYNLGLAYHELGKLEEAEDAYRHACELKPSSNRFRDDLNNCKKMLALQAKLQGKNMEAVKWFREALALDDGQPDCWYNLAKIYQELGDLPAARRAAEKAVTLDPDDADFRNFRDNLQKISNESRNRNGR